MKENRVLPEYGTPLTQIHISDDQSPGASQHCHDMDKHLIVNAIFVMMVTT